MKGYIFLLLALVLASPAHALEWCGQDIEEGATYVKCDDPKVSDLSPIASLTSVKTLSLAGTGIHDLSPIGGWFQLKRLVINETSVSDLSPIADLTGLKALSAKRSMVQDLSPLVGLSSLEELIIADCPNMETPPIIDLSPMMKLSKLKKLDVSRVKIESFVPLHGVASLKKLTTLMPGDWGVLHPARARYRASLCEFLKAQPRIRGTHCVELVEE